MQGFLLDTNHLDAFYRQVPSVIERLRKAPHEWWAFACAITLGEVEAGHRMTQPTDQLKREEYEKFINENFVPYAIDITAKTRIKYGKIMGKIWKNHTPPPGRNTEKYLIENGVDLNDVWFVACAWEHNIIAVTHDNMPWIKEAVAGKVTFEDWLEKSDPNPLLKSMRS